MTQSAEPPPESPRGALPASEGSAPDALALPDDEVRFLTELRQRGGTVVALTGAGLSAESGLPTFRGPEGYWTVGSREYTPQEMGTWAMFAEQPAQVWSWYLYRLRQCRDARPNAGHRALVSLERSLGDRFHLVTQNVDGLHREAGQTDARTSEIHGNIRWMRCSRECTSGRWLLPAELLAGPGARDTQLSDEDRGHLRCPACGSWARPHVLWFDEYYDDTNYDATRALRKSMQADLLLIVGTSGATNLPNTAARECLRAGGHLLEINPDRTPFTELAERSGGTRLSGPATRWLPAVVATLTPQHHA